MSTTDAFDFAREAAWEVQAVERAVARYREAAAGRHPDELPPGRRVLAETVGPVSARIAAMQDDAVAHRSRAELWHAPILGFKADVLAVVSVSCALRSGVQGTTLGKPITAFARTVTAALRDQEDHDRFVREQTAARKGRQDGDELLRRFRRAFPNADRRAWSRFAAKIEGARSSRWEEPVRLAVGATLAAALSLGAPEWFAVEQAGDGPAHRRPLCIVLTSYAVERLAEATTRAEVARPMMMPMLIPPNPWRYVPKPQEAA